MIDQPTRDRICELLADGKSLRAVCREEGMPTEAAVRKLALSDAEFGAQYTHARAVGYDMLGDELLEIADTTQLGVIRTVKPDGSVEEKQADMIEHRRLRVDARKWMLAKMLPKKYGDKITQEHTGADGGPIQTTFVLTPLERD
jgi:hypothetical protein